MTLSRRRFLTISAAFAGLPALAHAHNWQGHAFGAEVSLTIHGPEDQSTAALQEARGLIEQVQRLFSLYDHSSSISLLNRTGKLLKPDPRFIALIRAADKAYDLTEGLFDPTVQPLWNALAQGRNTSEGIGTVDWKKLRFDADKISLARSQAITLNGIAQGYATDLVTDALYELGLTNALVNIGEYRGMGGPWHLGLSDPVHGPMGNRTLTSGAIATSSPAATQIGGGGHILHPRATPQWSTVSVEATSATLADSLSTAMVLAPRDQIEAIKATSDITRVTLVSFEDDLISL